MDNSLKALILAAGTIITCIVIGLGFYISRQASDTAYAATANTNKLSSEFLESDKTMYDGLDIPGSEVLNVITKFKNETLSIVVTTKAGNTTYYNHSVSGSDGGYTLGGATSSNTQEAKKVMSESYINPTKQFLGTVLRDANDAIVGIMFVQK